MVIANPALDNRPQTVRMTQSTSQSAMLDRCMMYPIWRRIDFNLASFVGHFFALLREFLPGKEEFTEYFVQVLYSLI